MAAREEDKAEPVINNLVCEGLGEKCQDCLTECPEKTIPNDEATPTAD